MSDGALQTGSAAPAGIRQHVRTSAAFDQTAAEGSNVCKLEQLEDQHKARRPQKTGASVTFETS